MVECADEGCDEGPVVLQEGAVAAFARDTLWTAEVQVDGVAVRSDKARGSKEVGGGVGAELDERRAVRRAAVEEGRLERLRAIGGGGGEKAGVEHGRVAERVWRGVSAGEESPGLGCQYRGLHGYRRERQTYSDCSTMGATMVFGEPMDS